MRGGGGLAGRARDQIKAGKDLRISQCPRAGRGGRRARGRGEDTHLVVIEALRRASAEWLVGIVQGSDEEGPEQRRNVALGLGLVTYSRPRSALSPLKIQASPPTPRSGSSLPRPLPTPRPSSLSLYHIYIYQRAYPRPRSSAHTSSGPAPRPSSPPSRRLSASTPPAHFHAPGTFVSLTRLPQPHESLASTSSH